MNYYKITCLAVLITLECVIIYYGVPSALGAFGEYWMETTVQEVTAIKEHKELLKGYELK